MMNFSGSARKGMRSRRLRDGHQGRVLGASADQRHKGLNQRQRERENEGVMADFRDHLP